MFSRRVRPDTVGASRRSSERSSREHRVQTARVVQVLHVVVAGGLEVHEHRHAAADRVELVEVDLDPEPARDRGDVQRSPFVEPPMAWRVTSELWNASAVMIRCGAEVLGRDLDRAPAGALGEALPSACTAGMVAPPGSIMPSASVMQAMVLAVPITMQVPAVGASRSFTSSISVSSSSPARVHAPEAAAVGARPEPLAPVVPGHHRAGGQDEGGHLRTRGGHELGGNGLVTARR